MHLQGLDLNLLIALDALLTECNVTRAAERINISQPGMSAALQKLRWYFKDELLERIGRRLEMTPRARDLAEPVRAILDQARRLTSTDDDFDPGTAVRLFHVAASTYCAEMLAPALTRLLLDAAPGISCQFDDLLPDTMTRLTDGGIDCAITLSQRLTLDPSCADRTFIERPLFTDRFVVALSTANHAVGDSIDYDEFCELPYIETRFGGNFRSLGEEFLRRQSKSPKPRMWLPTFQQCLQVVSSGDDMVTLAPERLVTRYARFLPLRAIEAPLVLPPLDEQLYWHPRHDDDPAHRWFRALVKQVGAEVAERGE